MTVVLVTGGRGYEDKKRVKKELDALGLKPYVDTIVNGGCPTGADHWARVYGETYRIPVLTVYADWYSSLGPASGPYRNARMLERDPDVVLAFPGGRGTASMVGLARGAIATGAAITLVEVSADG